MEQPLSMRELEPYVAQVRKTPIHDKMIDYGARATVEVGYSLLSATEQLKRSTDVLLKVTIGLGGLVVIQILIALVALSRQ